VGITPHTLAAAVITVKATPVNSSGTTPGDGLSASTVKFTVTLL